MTQKQIRVFSVFKGNSLESVTSASKENENVRAYMMTLALLNFDFFNISDFEYLVENCLTLYAYNQAGRLVGKITCEE